VRQGCVVAPDLFLTPMDWLLNHTNHGGFLGTAICTEPFTDLDFADDVALLTEVLSVLILALEIMDHKSKLLGLHVNWSVTKIQSTDASVSPGTFVPVAGDNVEVIESFTYLGVNIHNTGFSEHDIRKRIAIARNCMASLDLNIWHSSITLPTKLRLYRVHPPRHPLRCRNLVPYSTTYEELGCVRPVVSALHFTNPMVDPHLQRRGPPSY